MHQVFSVSPIFGIDYKLEDKPDGERVMAEHKEDRLEIVDDEDSVDTFAIYYADGDKEQDRDVVCDPSLGLAIEQLWAVIP